MAPAQKTIDYFLTKFRRLYEQDASVFPVLTTM